MDTKEYIDLIDELDDLEQEQIEELLQKDKRRQKYPPRNPKKLPPETRQFIHQQDDASRNFKYTYRAARFEEWWLLESLGDFYEHQWISDVLRRLKGGKEASVYLCRGGKAVDAPLVVAKVYRPRSLRNLKQDGQYRTGRLDLDPDGNIIVDDGSLHAIEKRTAYGEELRHQSWIAYEFQTMETLMAAGGDVPKPYVMGRNAILMGYVGDLSTAAPTLNSLDLEPDEARMLFERVVRNIDLLLANNRIHGDLSAYNILYWAGEITLIDFPQVTLPEANPAAWEIFLRDVVRVCQYFARQGVEADARKLAVDMWTSHGYKIKREIHPRYLDADKREDRQTWEKQKTTNKPG